MGVQVFSRWCGSERGRCRAVSAGAVEESGHEAGVWSEWGTKQRGQKGVFTEGGAEGGVAEGCAGRRLAMRRVSWCVQALAHCTPTRCCRTGVKTCTRQGRPLCIYMARMQGWITLATCGAGGGRRPSMEAHTSEQGRLG